MTRTWLDDNGYPIRHPETAEDKRHLQILEHEADRVRWDAALRQAALDRIGKRHRSDRETLSALFQTGLIGEAEAEAFARALEHHWEGRPDEAILVALPRIESVFRKWLDALGGVTHRPPEGDRPGRAKGLGDILWDLERLGPSETVEWCRFFRIALTEPAPGLNLRNRHLHGLAETATKQDATLVLRIAALLRLLRRANS